MNQKILTLVLALFIMFIYIVLESSIASAFTPSYNPNNLIDNPTFTNTSTMSPGIIQTFLSNIGSGIANYSDVEACDSTIAPYYNHCGQTISAAQIIYDSANAYGVNPRVILATLEKEQSLVTDRSPSAAQINCAMGYHSCSGYSGFFTQVDNGAWALKYNYEGAFGASTWLSWKPGTNYPCQSAKSGFYSAGLYPNNTVTFSNSGGTPVTITIANAATASLYCYTPYVGPYSVTGYSGSYNFVYYYQLWFGSTQTAVAYGWSYNGQGAFANSNMTTIFNRGNREISLAPGGTAYLNLQGINNGYQTWSQSVVHLGTSMPADRCSAFYNNSWLTCLRISMQEQNVVPGGTADFNFSVTAPQTPGSYREYFNLVADGVTWMNDPGAYYELDVVQPNSPDNSVIYLLSAGNTLTASQFMMSKDRHSVLLDQPDGNIVLYVDGSAKWSTGTSGYKTSNLLMQSDGNLVLYGANGQPDWSSGTAGNNGAYFVLQEDGNAVIYNSSGTPIWSSNTSGNPIGYNYVQHEINNSILVPNQELSTASRNYKLLFQNDGNLVLYNHNGTPLWSSGTAGKSSQYLDMQSDGNMVIYNKSFTPLWNSKTAGQGSSSLYMQDDGNLVIYNSNGVPTWNSGTAAR